MFSILRCGLAHASDNINCKVNIGSVFISPTIQNLIQKVNKEILDINKVFKPIKQKLTISTIKLMSPDKLNSHIDDAKVRALEKLQAPILMQQRAPIEEILEENNELKGFDTCKYVFTDITFGINDRDRYILVREPTGTLRKASWEERDRINQVYFPKERREFRVPKMFDDIYFEDALAKGKHLFILDRIIVQFEPDHPSYLHFMGRVFDHILDNRLINELRSTRYFTTLVLYCCMIKPKNVDDILSYLLRDVKPLVSNSTPHEKSLIPLSDEATRDANAHVHNYNNDHVTHENLLRAAHLTVLMYHEVQQQLNLQADKAISQPLEQTEIDFNGCLTSIGNYIQTRLKNAEFTNDSIAQNKLVALGETLSKYQIHFDPNSSDHEKLTDPLKHSSAN